jgi:hypothetical protein
MTTPRLSGTDMARSGTVTWACRGVHRAAQVSTARLWSPLVAN